MTVNEALSASERYLQKLADGLEALGPVETGEVLAEVQSHLTDAIAEAGDNESEALARFGSPELLATRILEERGILCGGPAIPEARGSKRLAALAIDIVLWVLLLWLCAIPALGMPVTPSTPPAVAVLAFVPLVAAVALSVWWWTKKRRERGYVTIGMNAMGLRRIRVGQTSRQVLKREIPGLARGNAGRVAAVLGVLVAVLILASISYAVFSSYGSGRQSQIQNAVRDGSTGVAIVSELYRMVAIGAQPGDLEGLFAPAAVDDAHSLVTRRSEGRIDSYAINAVELLSYTAQAERDENAAYETLLLVGVSEHAPGSDAPEQFQYRVALIGESRGEGAWEGQWFILSVEQVGQ